MYNQQFSYFVVSLLMMFIVWKFGYRPCIFERMRVKLQESKLDLILATLNARVSFDDSRYLTVKDRLDTGEKYLPLVNPWLMMIVAFMVSLDRLNKESMSNETHIDDDYSGHIAIIDKQVAHNLLWFWSRAFPVGTIFITLLSPILLLISRRTNGVKLKFNILNPSTFLVESLSRTMAKHPTGIA